MGISMEATTEMKAEDKHRWKYLGYDKETWMKKWICLDCKCVKHQYHFKVKGRHFGGELYERSNIHFDGRPDCIKWEIENDKTID